SFDPVRVTAECSMSHDSLTLAVLFTIGCVSVFGYSFATRTHLARPDSEAKSAIATAGPAVDAPQRQRTAEVESSGAPALRPEHADGMRLAANTMHPSPRLEADTAQGSVALGEPSPSQTAPPEVVTKWIADAAGDNSRARAAALVALSTAPRSQAVPV